MRDNLLPVPVDAVFEDGDIRLEEHDGARVFGLADHLYFGERLADFVLLHVNGTVLVYQHLRVFRKCVHDGCTHTVKTARNLVARIVPTELTAGMKRSHDSLERRDLGLRVNTNRNAASVVCYAYVAAWKECDLNIVCEPAHGLIA